MNKEILDEFQASEVKYNGRLQILGYIRLLLVLFLFVMLYFSFESAFHSCFGPPSLLEIIYKASIPVAICVSFLYYHLPQAVKEVQMDTKCGDKHFFRSISIFAGILLIFFTIAGLFSDIETLSHIIQDGIDWYVVVGLLIYLVILAITFQDIRYLWRRFNK